MNILQLSSEFIEYKRKTLEESSIANYKGRIDVFSEYITKTSGTSAEAVLRGFGKEDMKKAMEYYRSQRKGRRKIRYKSSMNIYVSTIREFFKFLIQEKKIENITFNKNDNCLDDFVKDVIENQMKLKDCEDSESLNNQEVIKLIEVCNLALNKDVEEIKEFKATYKDPYYYFVSAIAIKIALFTGLKIKNIYHVKRRQFDMDYNVFKYNGYRLNLPNQLSCDIRKLFELQEKIVPGYGDESEIFVTREGRASTGNDLFDLMDKVVGSRASKKISSYVMKNMIRKGINTGMMLELTGQSYNTYYCLQEMVDEEYTQEQRDRYMSAKLRQLDLFDHL